jgi:hypothetical protein
MGIIDDKRRVFGQISAFRTLNDGFPEINLTDSFPSLNNNASSLDFLIDILKTLIGFEEMKAEVVDILTYRLRDIELEIKKALKLELKSIVSCGVDPSLPDFIKNTGSGIDIKISKVDFLDILKTNPQSDNGKFIYDDYTSGLNSTDFNTYLYYTIQSASPEDWGSQTLSDDIFTINYIEDNGTTNVINIKATPTYSTKKLTDLNNDYIDSINLFGSDKMLYNIIDGLFGTLTSVLNKSQKQIENEEKINNVINCIINTEDDGELSDNFFTFSNPEIQSIEENARNRRKGIKILKNCNNVQSSVPLQTLEDFNNNFTATTNSEEVKSVIDESLNDMADLSAQADPNEKNRYTIKLNFIELLIRRLMLSIANFIISPKVIMIFLVNYKIIYGQNEEYDDAIDFLKKNKELIRSIVNKIRDIIIEILLKKALKEISVLVAESAIKREIEVGKNYVSQLLSLTGTPPAVIRLLLNII